MCPVAGGRIMFASELPQLNLHLLVGELQVNNFFWYPVMEILKQGKNCSPCGTGMDASLGNRAKHPCSVDHSQTGSGVVGESVHKTRKPRQVLPTTRRQRPPTGVSPGGAASSTSTPLTRTNPQARRPACEARPQGATSLRKPRPRACTWGLRSYLTRGRGNHQGHRRPTHQPRPRQSW